MIYYHDTSSSTTTGNKENSEGHFSCHILKDSHTCFEIDDDEVIEIDNPYIDGRSFFILFHSLPFMSNTHTLFR